MKTQTYSNNAFCCDQMAFLLNEKKVLITYDYAKQQFLITSKDGKQIVIVTYCPWCGADLKTPHIR